MPIHIRANKEDFAPTVLLVGDPGRAEIISQKFREQNLLIKTGDS